MSSYSSLPHGPPQQYPSARPYIVERYSSRTGIAKREELVLDSWTEDLPPVFEGPHWKRGGPEVILIASVALVLWSATGFLYHARTHELTVKVQDLNDSVINVSNIGSLLSFVGAILGTAWKSSLAILGGRWLLRALEGDSQVKFGHWR
jgi:hypothetical protein